MTRCARKEVRQTIALLEAQGWRVVGRDSGQHIVLQHPSGATVRTSNTPSCSRARANALAAARRAIRRTQAP